ncbi:O-antigen biosynthesis protein [Alteracholeplasma palmae J233]|uniref:O-antigen biosynthesis protein n=1 Tax=Alteracholeplasma palmae (strain ATCC 49389 / J233) TaxID=1318466 RepID=U4KS39_ALTPJ|nr:glycosyltransferase family 4 protein [Alteracholeplasma palmae]CCV64696.1 O-antigen biosynthesis protein [Alteracholeplasma palmae J233]
MKNKVLFLYNHDVVAYNFTFEIVKAFLSNGVEVVIVSPYGKKIDHFIDAGCKYIELDIERRNTNIFKDLKLIREYKKIFKKEKPDCIFGFTIKPNIYGAIAAKKYKIPFIPRISGLGSSFQNTKKLKFKLIKNLYKFANKSYRRVYFENKDNASVFLSNVCKLKDYKVISGSGVNIDKFSYVEYPQKEKTKFLFLGRIMREKGIEEYLTSAEYLKNKYGNTVSFSIAGFYEENYRDKILEYQEKGYIKYLGVLENSIDVISESHCLILPSYHEGMSNVMLEAQAIGRPVIGTDIPGVRETFLNKISGYTCTLRDSKDLIEKIEVLINMDFNSASNMGKLGRKHVESNFDRAKIVEEYLKIYEEIKDENTIYNK